MMFAEDIVPLDEYTYNLLERLPDATLAEEQARLEERLTATASKLAAIIEIRGQE